MNRKVTTTPERLMNKIIEDLSDWGDIGVDVGTFVTSEFDEGLEKLIQKEFYEVRVRWKVGNRQFSGAKQIPKNYSKRVYLGLLSSFNDAISQSRGYANDNPKTSTV